MSAFAKQATVTASTKRASVAGGKRGLPTTNLTSLLCTPLDPINAEIAQRLGLQAPYEALQTFTESTDILPGDTLVVGTKEYPIKAVAEWVWRGAAYRHLVLEDLKV